MEIREKNDLPLYYLKYPLITEKSTNDTTLSNSYHFVVDKKADKLTIKQLIEYVYDVKVEKIQTCHLPPKKFGYKRLNRFKTHYKKAIIKLAPDNEIDLYQN